MTIDSIPVCLRKRWHIRAGVSIADTRSSHVYRVERQDADPAILKILKPEGMNELPGMAFLEWRAGKGAVLLIDRFENACLVEDAGRQILRDHYTEHGDEAAIEIILSVLADLHSSSPLQPPKGLVPLRRHFQSLFQAVDRGAYSDHADLLRWGAALAERLLAEQTDIRPLHGDLHHDNIVTGGPRGWLAIDPQGLIGDPAYDVANVFGNPLGGAKDILDPKRIARLAKSFSEVLGCSERKILRFAGAHSAVSVCWSMAAEPSTDSLENIAERSAFALIVRRMLGSTH
ncbi:streptomycin resistance protein [Neorhizobium sp. P12A]|uniref:aminoglycoside phosphotransferase family protein n=1 Tax=Rhizobium/Agrobacterium group TaxID=227290 RepID=UPI00104FB0CB|nr:MULTISPECIES: aminoglycoside phosphotransferase family protein [Rhizobium/Agrobacterium group]KAA0698333.1 streptomycin resistance protein [Neorhizobium sp. P12A]TCR92889.1 streptomycin 6-kinase [Rhizobium sp. BK376]